MDLARLIPSALLFVTAIVFVVRANFIFYRILDDVNASRAASQQISFLFVSLRFGEVLSEHGKLFPKDLNRRQMKISIVAGFALLLLLVLTLAVGQYLCERYVKCRFYVVGGAGIPRAAHRAA